MVADIQCIVSVATNTKFPFALYSDRELHAVTGHRCPDSDRRAQSNHIDSGMATTKIVFLSRLL